MFVPGVQSSLPDFYARFKNKLRTDEQGADTMVWLAISPAVKKVASGLFFQGNLNKTNLCLDMRRIQHCLFINVGQM